MLRISVLSVLIIAAFAVTITTHASAATDEELLNAVVAGINHQCQVITSGKGTVTNTRYELEDGKSGEPSVTRITGVFAGEKFRLANKLANQDKVLSEVSYDGQKAIETTPRLNPAVRIYAGRRDSVASLFSTSFDPRNCNPHREKIETLCLTKAKVRQELLNGDECVVIEHEDAEPSDGHLPVKWIAWVNPAKGFTIPRLEMRHTLPDGSTSLWLNVNEVKQYPGGVWAISKQTASRYAEGRLAQKYTNVWEDDFELNVPVTARDLDLLADLPSGTTVHDGVNDMYYTVP